MPESCYILRVVFQPIEIGIKWYAVLFLPFLLSLGLLWRRKKDSALLLEDVPIEQPQPERIDSFPLGRYQFLPNEQCLFFEENKIPLSVKENELLKLFTLAPNQLLARDYLLKTIGKIRVFLSAGAWMSSYPV